MPLPFRARAIVGMVHLEPLPGAPRSRMPLREVVARAVDDARALAQGGCDAVLVENFGDAPFAERLGPEGVVALGLAARAVREALPEGVALGVNALRNDAPAALAVAHATGADFIRCNVWSGVAWTDQGQLEGCARETTLLRRRLGADGVALFADVHVKHASHPGPLVQAVADNERNLCDAHIVSGTGTGKAADPASFREALHVARLPVVVGSGVTAANLGAYAGAAGFIVGTAFKGPDGRVDPKRVEALVAARDASPAPPA